MCDMKILRQIFWMPERNWTVFKSDRRFDSQDIITALTNVISLMFSTSN